MHVLMKAFCLEHDHEESERLSKHSQKSIGEGAHDCDIDVEPERKGRLSHVRAARSLDELQDHLTFFRCVEKQSLENSCELAQPQTHARMRRGLQMSACSNKLCVRVHTCMMPRRLRVCGPFSHILTYEVFTYAREGEVCERAYTHA
jgi:hypothetical protein